MNSFIKKIFLPNFLRSYSADISRFHSLLDLLVALYIFSRGNTEFSLFYYLTLNSFLLICLRTLQKSFRNFSSRRIIYEITLVYLITSFFTFFINTIFIKDFIDSFFNYVFIKNILFYIYLIFTHFITRILLKNYRKKGGNTRSILIWGDYNSSKKVIDNIVNSKWLGFNIEAWFSPEVNVDNSKVISYKGGFDEMKNWLKNNSVDSVIIASDNHDLRKVISFFGNTSLNVYYLPNWSDSTMKLSISNIGSQRIFSIWESNQLPFVLLIKRIADFVMSILILLLVFPLMIFIYLILKYKSNDDSFYKQERYGYNGKAFLIYKFRTMKNADSGLKKDLQQVMKNDKRVTRIGKILRKYSLDELPQLFNVIKGDMSLVGPRPHAVSHNETYRHKINGYMQRHSIKPGMTGLAQIKGLRGETKNIELMRKRIKADLEYIQNWNLILDLKILLKTFFIIFNGSAY